MNDWKNIEIQLNESYPLLLREIIAYYTLDAERVDATEQEYMLNSIELFQKECPKNTISFSVWNLRTKTRFPHLLEKVECERRRIKEEKKRIELRKDFSTQLIGDLSNISHLLLSEHTKIFDSLKKQCDEEIENKFPDLIPTCPISLEPIINHCFLPCGHRFERENVMKLERSICPLCRNYFDKTNLLFNNRGQQVMKGGNRY